MNSITHWRAVGQGTAVWQGDPVSAEVVEIRSADDVLGALERDDLNVIVLMHTAGAMMLSPIFGDLAGVICTSGSVGAHVAIMSREFAIPCLVATDLSEPDIHGRIAEIRPDGTVHVRQDVQA